MITITRRLEFDAGHRLVGHEGKCRNLHGHRYVVLLECRAPRLDSVGRVVDFGVIKELCGGWIDKNWDHNFLMHEDDPLLPAISAATPVERVWVAAENPTAENMAFWLSQKFTLLLEPKGIEVRSVTVFETPNCSATWRKE